MSTKDELLNGHLLRKAPDLLLPAEIRDGLKTSIFGRERIDHFPVIDSTNVHARMIADRRGSGRDRRRGGGPA